MEMSARSLSGERVGLRRVVEEGGADDDALRASRAVRQRLPLRILVEDMAGNWKVSCLVPKLLPNNYLVAVPAVSSGHMLYLHLLG